jgi:hypothetical protein
MSKIFNNLKVDRTLSKFIPRWSCTGYVGSDHLPQVNDSMCCKVEGCTQTFLGTKEFYQALFKIVLSISIIELVLGIILFISLKQNIQQKEDIIQQKQNQITKDAQIYQKDIEDCLKWNILISEVALNARSYPPNFNKVREIQKHLKELGFFENQEITGKFGKATSKAIYNYQKSCQNKLK